MRLAMKGVQYEVSENVLKTRPNVSETGIKTFFLIANGKASSV